MTLKPCVQCGEPSDRNRCPEHRPKDTRRPHEKGHVHTNTARWKALSKKIRKAAPFCEQCGAVESLTVDHIIPYSVCPELGYAVENLRVLCKPCNGRRQATWTTDDAQPVLARLYAAYNRRPTRTVRNLIATAERAVSTRGGPPNGSPFRPAVKAHEAMKLAADAVG